MIFHPTVTSSLFPLITFSILQFMSPLTNNLNIQYTFCTYIQYDQKLRYKNLILFIPPIYIGVFSIAWKYILYYPKPRGEYAYYPPSHHPPLFGVKGLDHQISDTSDSECSSARRSECVSLVYSMRVMMICMMVRGARR